MKEQSLGFLSGHKRKAVSCGGDSTHWRQDGKFSPRFNLSHKILSFQRVKHPVVSFVLGSYPASGAMA